MISIDYSLLIQIANFLILMIALNVLLFRPIREMIRQRKEKFAGFESDIQSLSSRASESAGRIEAKVVEARRDGFLKKDELKGLGQVEEKKILALAAEKAEAEVEKIRLQITGEIDVARQALKADLDAFSRELAQKVLGRSLS